MEFPSIPSPCFVLEEKLLKRNLELLQRVQVESGCKIICALKGFSMFSTFPMVSSYLAGTTASSLNEVLLGKYEMGKEVHLYAPSYKEAELAEALPHIEHITFNSFSQWERFKGLIQTTNPKVSAAIRINPEYSEVSTGLYNPCIRFSRLGVTHQEFRADLMDGIEGLHFHSLCGQNSDVLERTLEALEPHFGEWFHRVKWVNFGGGHHITRADYDVAKLIEVIRNFKAKYHVEVILEPGEAVGWQTGFLMAEVTDLMRNEKEIALLDISVSAHMPDCLEMPYRPEIRGAGQPGEYPYNYLLGGSTCLAGDLVGEYSFPEPLVVGQHLIFEDMIHYTMVKTTMFNGVAHPSIGILQADGVFRLVRSFSYEDYRNRLS
jgi:carboxynorspermidine decarboxylase